MSPQTINSSGIMAGVGGHRPGPGQRADAPENLAPGSDGDPVSWCSDRWGWGGTRQSPNSAGAPRMLPCTVPESEQPQLCPPHEGDPRPTAGWLGLSSPTSLL